MTRSREAGLEVNAEKIKCMSESFQQNAGQAKGSFENVAKFKNLGTVTNQNRIYEEIKSRLNSGKTSRHSVKNLLSSHLLSKNLKNKFTWCFV
jgi:hypothetical protein